MTMKQMPFSNFLFDVPASESEKVIQSNKILDADRPFHNWYRFVLSFPPHLVRKYILDFGLTDHSTVLDPFCGTGTTIVESKLHGIHAIGIDANPVTQFASRVKSTWDIDPDLLRAECFKIAERTFDELRQEGINDGIHFEGDLDDLKLRILHPEAKQLLLGGSISALPLHKTLVLLSNLRVHSNQPYFEHALLALTNALIGKISNLHFGPEVGVIRPKKDVAVITAWLDAVQIVVQDLKSVQGKRFPTSRVYLGDSRHMTSIGLEACSVDGVITSTPYPNEKDYTRATRLESVILGFVNNKLEVRNLKKQMVRSNTRSVYKDDDDDKWVAGYSKIHAIAEQIEKRRIELEKTSGFERLYGRVTKLYFGGMVRHLESLKYVLKSGAQLAYVVGDQASYLRVMIPTGQLLAELAHSLGYEVIRIDLFRTRFSTATKQHLREEVVILRWNG